MRKGGSGLSWLIELQQSELNPVQNNGMTVTSLANIKKLVLIWPLGGAVRRAANFHVSERLC